MCALQIITENKPKRQIFPGKIRLGRWILSTNIYLTIAQISRYINYDQNTGSLLFRIMKAITALKIKKDGNNANEEDREFIATYGKTLDFMDKNGARKIVEYCT